MLLMVTSDLRRREAPSANWAIGQHLLVAPSVTGAGRRRLVHGPVARGKDFLEAL